MLKALFQGIARRFGSVCRAAGFVLLLLYAASWCGLADFRLCIGKPGACGVMSIPTDRPATGRQA